MRYFVVLATLAATAVTGLVLAGSAAGTADEISFRLATPLTGAEEVPGPGDPDGSGNAVLRIRPAAGQVCFRFAVRKVEPITAAHIHKAPFGQAGPVVVNLSPATPSLKWEGCTTAAKDLLKDIKAHPTDYYVNVHNPPFPGGALRGQLGD